VAEIIGLIVFGAILGLFGRLAAPGRQDIPVWLTILAGIGGALIGYWLAGILGVEDTRGIDWIRWIISIAAAAVLVVIAANMWGKRTRV